MINKVYDFIHSKDSFDFVSAYKPLFMYNSGSYTFNCAMVKQGSAELLEEYNYVKSVHDLLNIRKVNNSNCNLVRVGKKYDGGYVLLANKQGCFSDNKIAYSLGISDDVSFDLSVSQKDYDIYQYDHTISGLPQENKHFHWKKIGITGYEETNELKNLSTLLVLNGHDDLDGMLLKMDIEGHEYGTILNADEQLIKRFDQIVIEFHDILDFDNRDITLKVFEKINKTHQLIHIHANNNSYVSFNGALVTPNVFEATYVIKDKFDFSPHNIVYPSEIDMPCRREFPDILLGRWNVD